MRGGCRDPCAVFLRNLRFSLHFPCPFRNLCRPFRRAGRPWWQKRRGGYHIAGGKSRLRCGRNLLRCGLCTESVAGAEGMRVAFPCCGFAGFWPKLACDHYLQCELSVKPQRMFCHILHPVGSMIVRYEFFLNHFTHAEGRNRLIGRALRPSPKETSLAPHG